MSTLGVATAESERVFIQPESSVLRSLFSQELGGGGGESERWEAKHLSCA